MSSNNEIIVRSQVEYDALPSAFDRDVTIYIMQETGATPIYVARVPERSTVVARGSAHVVARGSAHVVAWESAHVEAWESAHVVARGSAHVEAWESAHVVARGSAHVVAWESAHVVARGSAHVVAWESAHVVAWESAHVEARGSAHVEAWGTVSVYLQSDVATVALFMFAVCFAIAKGAVTKHSPTAIIVQPHTASGTDGWLEANGMEKADRVIVFKRVSMDLETQENAAHLTRWPVGSTAVHPHWQPEGDECGAGKFHACSRPYFCDEFRSEEADRYIAIEVATQDLYAWPNASFPHKIAFRAGTVLYECDRYGKPFPSPPAQEA